MHNFFNIYDDKYPGKKNQMFLVVHVEVKLIFLINISKLLFIYEFYILTISYFILLLELAPSRYEKALQSLLAQLLIVSCINFHHRSTQKDVLRINIDYRL